MEKGNNRVKVIEVCKICPSNSTSKFSLPLAAFDWLHLRSPQMERTFFYQFTNIDSSFSSIVSNLKHSLSLTLQHFLPLAGNLLWPDHSPFPFILYAPNDAVSFTVAETDSDFHRVSGDHPRQLKHYYPSHLLPNIVQSSNSAIPMMAIQVTEFRNHGFSIGLATHRVLFDGKSSNIFIKSWAHICKQLANGNRFCCLPLELIPSFERATNLILQNPFHHLVPKNRSLKFSPRSMAPPNWFRATFKLTPIQIQKLENRVSEWIKNTSSQQFYLSKFVVVYAHVLVCLIKAKQLADGKKIDMSFHADARWLLDPPVSSNYIGNCVTYPSVLVEATEFTEPDGLPIIAKKISDLIVELRTSRVINLAKYSDNVDSGGGSVEICFNVDSPKSKFYETDFGWGKPKKIDVALEECNSFSLLDTRDGDGGVEVGLLLPHHQLDVFASLFSEFTEID